MRPRQLQSLGLDHFPRNITEFDMNQFFSYDSEEIQVIRNSRGSCHQTAVAIQIGFLRMTGRPLSGLDTVPTALLRHLRRHLGIDTPDLTSLRALYGDDPRTMFRHQKTAANVLGFQEFTTGRHRSLSRHLRREAKLTRNTNQLLSLAKQWLYDLKILLPHERLLRSIVHKAQVAAEEDIAAVIAAAVPESVRRRLIRSVMAKHENSRRTVLEWLQAHPKRRSTKDLRMQIEKLDHLQSLGVHKINLADVDLAMQQAYAAEVRRRRPTRLNRLPEPRRMVALVCFLSVRMRELMDEILDLSSLNTNRIVRQASDRVRSNDARAVGALIEAIEGIRQTLQNDELPLERRFEQAIALLPEDPAPASFASRLRAELSSSARQTRPILRRLVKLPLSESGDQEVVEAMNLLAELYEHGDTKLPEEVDSGFASEWKDQIENPDRQKALRGFESAVLQELKQRLRSGTLWVDASIEHRSREELFISEADWKRGRDRYFSQLAVPKKPGKHLQTLNDAIAGGLQALDEAVASGEIPIEGRRVGIEKLEKEPEPEDLESHRRRLVDLVGNIQLPELLVEMDSHVRFSWAILGRPPRSEKELIYVYGGLLAHGTELDATGVALMIPDLSVETITSFMQLFDDSKALRLANAGVIEFMRQHDIVEQWGDGSLMSSDAMSLEATRDLWKARVDPKHRRYAIGVYTHLLDQWGIIYDQPVVLGERQAGVAIDGALRQTSDAKSTRLAVDTHGYTNFGMGLAKFFGLDLCPRMRDLRNRILYAPKGVPIPEKLMSVVSRGVSIPSIERGWDGLGRIAASVKSGRTNATVVLRVFGSASREDPVHKAGTELGKLHRTLFLLDYFTNPDFRRELHRVLNHGESVHQLQRAIYSGNIVAKQGRRPDRLQAISGSLTLLTNLVMAWMTHRLQIAVDGEAKNIATTEILRRVAPDQFSGINLRGVFRFPAMQIRENLLAPVDDRSAAANHPKNP